MNEKTQGVYEGNPSLVEDKRHPTGAANPLDVYKDK